ncbi:hypothetical protein [Mesorhizobium sp. M0998]|uniref:hypothetical protein n=1 Tax=Mesorhizobium sp. M0998 TaxID=2957044 RepID=UPI00333CA8B9
MAKGSMMIGDLTSRLLGAPVVAGVSLGKTLTNLSTSSRIRCFEWLADKPVSWLMTDEDDAVARRRRHVLAAGGHDRLIAHFSDFMDSIKDRRGLCGHPRPAPTLLLCSRPIRAPLTMRSKRSVTVFLRSHADRIAAREPPIPGEQHAIHHRQRPHLLPSHWKTPA